jgi:hypothetical protein
MGDRYIVTPPSALYGPTRLATTRLDGTDQRPFLTLHGAGAPYHVLTAGTPARDHFG